ncbi:uncharacterized protein PAC_17604 [Phialocephala subalpina]|uniref:SET domain-containing protein n=1 Tax=Phialocephala subalpina TaxID=576137 RepID=A0A1L7XRS0_9HELO|nr:uncharacterized protein PAC_17604 [Phialocephala subalpina]
MLQFPHRIETTATDYESSTDIIDVLKDDKAVLDIELAHGVAKNDLFSVFPLGAKVSKRDPKAVVKSVEGTTASPRYCRPLQRNPGPKHQRLREKHHSESLPTAAKGPSLVDLQLTTSLEINRLFPTKDRGQYEVVQKGESLSKSIIMSIPEELKASGCTHIEDVLKFIVTERPASFESLSMPAAVSNRNHRGDAAHLLQFLDELSGCQRGNRPGAMADENSNVDEAADKWEMRSFTVRTKFKKRNSKHTQNTDGQLSHTRNLTQVKGRQRYNLTQSRDSTWAPIKLDIIEGLCPSSVNNADNPESHQLNLLHHKSSSQQSKTASMEQRITVPLAGGKKVLKIKGVTSISIPREIISNHLFERKPHPDPNTRYGIFAKVDISKDTTIFEETVLCYAGRKYDTTKEEFDAAKERAYNNLDETRKAMFDTLQGFCKCCNGPTQCTHSNVVQIFDMNSFGGPRDGPVDFNDDGTRWAMRAELDIKKGDEITISYITVSGDIEDRKDLLKKAWGFDCKCDACAAGLPIDNWVKSHWWEGLSVGDIMRMKGRA